MHTRKRRSAEHAVVGVQRATVDATLTAGRATVVFERRSALQRVLCVVCGVVCCCTPGPPVTRRLLCRSTAGGTC
jgi:hypothetical protein